VDADSGKERSLLFTRDKLKLRDRSGKNTIVKEAYGSVRLELGSDMEGVGLTLSLQLKKGVTNVQLRAESRQARDLIYLTLETYRRSGGAPTPGKPSEQCAAPDRTRLPPAEACSGRSAPPPFPPRTPHTERHTRRGAARRPSPAPASGSKKKYAQSGLQEAPAEVEGVKVESGKGRSRTLSFGRSRKSAGK